MKERFFYIDSRTLITQKGTYKIILVYDAESFATVNVFVDDKTFNYYKELESLTDITLDLKFTYDNKSGLYRLSIQRKD